MLPPVLPFSVLIAYVFLHADFWRQFSELPALCSGVTLWMKLGHRWSGTGSLKLCYSCPSPWEQVTFFRPEWAIKRTSLTSTGVVIRTQNRHMNTSQRRKWEQVVWQHENIFVKGSVRLFGILSTSPLSSVYSWKVYLWSFSTLIDYYNHKNKGSIL